MGFWVVFRDFSKRLVRGRLACLLFNFIYKFGVFEKLGKGLGVSRLGVVVSVFLDLFFRGGSGRL